MKIIKCLNISHLTHLCHDINQLCNNYKNVNKEFEGNEISEKFDLEDYGDYLFQLIAENDTFSDFALEVS